MSVISDADVSQSSGEPAGGAEFRTTDPRSAVRFVDGAYGGSIRIGLADGDEAFRHVRVVGHGFAVDEVVLSGRARMHARPESGVVVVEALSGRVRYSDESRELTLGEGNSLLSAPSLPLSLRTDDATLRVVLVDETLLRRVVAERLGPVPGSVVFDAAVPESDAMAATWARTLTFAHDTVRAARVSPTPLLDEACGRMLAAAVLSCFPNSAKRDSLDEHGAPMPIQLRRAMSFIKDSSHADIGLHQIAESVHLSPRAIQYLFRRHMDTTPTEYLRRVRLRGAHEDLLAGGPSTTTVSEVAAKWGFGHTGRFAVLYRQTYGLSPHVTLRH